MSIWEIAEVDKQLVVAAEKMLQRSFSFRKHSVGAAMRLKSGKIITAVNLETIIQKVSICAESAALVKALEYPDDPIETIVVVRFKKQDDPEQGIEVIPSCGVCRELLTEYAPDANAVIDDAGELKKIRYAELLPYKYLRRKL